MKVTLKKDNFLANPKNKQRVINTLSHFLQENNCPTYHAEGDVDVLIVKTDVESARDRNIIITIIIIIIIIIINTLFRHGKNITYKIKISR